MSDDYLDTVETQLAELAERGAHRSLRARAGAAMTGSGAMPDERRRPRLGFEVLGFAASLAAAVVVAVVALTSLHGGSGKHHAAASHPRPSHAASGSHPNGNPTAPKAATRSHRTHRGAQPAGGPVPAGFGPESFTAIGEVDWWLLGSAPCGSPPCTSIVRTQNGGRTFVGIPAPRTDAVSQLRFADPQDGFAFGPQLWVTHNGGATWRQVDIGGTVRDLEIGAGYAYAIVSRPGGGAGRLARAPVNSDSWSTLPAAGDAFTGLWAHGSDVLLESVASSKQSYVLMVSHDDGASFTAHAVPPSVACQFQEQAAPVIWAHCATGMLSGVWRSTDEGVSFGTSHGSGGESGPELPNSAAFAAASSTTAVVGYRQLYRTANGGVSYTPSRGPAGITWWQYLGFTDATHGVALGYIGTQTPSHERLYYTTDGGQSYHLVTIRSS